MTLSFVAQATIRDTVTFNNVIPAQTNSFTSTSPAPTLRTSAMTATGYSLGKIYISGQISEINGTTSDLLSDNKIEIRHPNGTKVSVALLGGSYTGASSFSNLQLSVGIGTTPPWASSWEFRFINNFNDNGTPNDSEFSFVTFDFSDDIAGPSGSVDLGVVADTQLGGGTQANYITPDVTTSHTGGNVHWYKFVINDTASAANKKYLDIDTIGTTDGGTPDTQIGLYNAAGTLIATDDNSGGGLLSSLSFGWDLGPRIVPGSGAPGGVGQNGSLGAGTYFIAVAGPTASFGSNFNVSTTSTNTTMNVQLNFRCNFLQGYTPPSATNLGTLTDSQSNYDNADTQATATGGNVHWYQFTLSHDVKPANGYWLDIDTENSTLSGGGLADTSIAVFNSAGAFIAGDDDSGSGVSSQLAFGASVPPRYPTPPSGETPGSPGNGRNGTLTAGTYYVAVAMKPSYFGSGPAGESFSTDTTADIKLNLRTNVGQTFTAPIGADLGQVYDTTSTYLTADFNQSQTGGSVFWYKFTIDRAVTNASGYWLDIDTEASINSTPTVGCDTVIALFDSLGNRVATDDESGSGTMNSRMSMLSFGQTAPARGPVNSFTGSGAVTGLSATGQAGSLPAGTYYLAVSKFQQSSGFGWQVYTNSTDTTSAIQVNFRTNLPAPANNVTGRLQLNDLSTGPAGYAATIKFYSGTTLVATSNATLDGTGAYTVTPVLPNGTYTVIASVGAPWLDRKTTVTVTGTNVTVPLIALRNGDVNGDGRVNLADFSKLSSYYGRTSAGAGWTTLDAQGVSPSMADLTKDGRVNLSDFSALSSGYGATNDTP